MKKYSVLLLVVFLGVQSFSQNSAAPSQELETASLIDSIGWHSFKVLSNYGSKLEIVDANAKQLEFKSKNDVSNDLLAILKQDEKTVIAHLILTKLWEKEVFFLTKNHHDAEDGMPSLTIYMVNNLSWSVINSKPKIDVFEQDRIYKYWLRRINEY